MAQQQYHLFLEQELNSLREEQKKNEIHTREIASTLGMILGIGSGFCYAWFQQTPESVAFPQRGIIETLTKYYLSMSLGTGIGYSTLALLSRGVNLLLRTEESSLERSLERQIIYSLEKDRRTTPEHRENA